VGVPEGVIEAWVLCTTDIELPAAEAEPNIVKLLEALSEQLANDRTPKIEKRKLTGFMDARISPPSIIISFKVLSEYFIEVLELIEQRRIIGCPTTISNQLFDKSGLDFRRRNSARLRPTEPLITVICKISISPITNDSW